MTKNEVLEKLSNGEIDVATAGALLAASGGNGNRLLVKRNSSGGLFVRHPGFRAVSARTGKPYTASFNMPWEAAVGTFTGKDSKEILAAIGKFVAAECKAAEKVA